MTMLFFSSDNTEVEQVCREFSVAGIPCEVKHQDSFSEAEVWIQNDQDCNRALLLCVERNIGFAHRPIMPVEEEALEYFQL
jgi:hypothetical protein